MPNGLSRRSFLKLAATAGAAAAVPGCEPAARKLVPYVVPDKNVSAGIPSFFATTCNECPAHCGLIATVREGRATHLDGNPADPISNGSICARGQAGLQGLYNPDRLAFPQTRDSNGALTQVSWDDALKTLGDKLATASKAGKDRVAFLGLPQGPTFRKIVEAWTAANNSSRAIFYAPLNNEPMHEASQTLFGRRDTPIYRIDQAEVLVSFGANFLETWGSPIEFNRQYAEFRAPKQRRGGLTIGRSFYVGPRLSMTAAKCDEWVAVAPDAEMDIAFGILNVMLKQRWISQNSGVDLSALGTLVASYDADVVSQRTGVPAETISRIGEAFGKADGALAIAGTDDPAAHYATLILNSVTGNFGKTIMFLDGAPDASINTENVKTLVDAMRDGKVDVLLVTGANPVYSMPPEYRVAEALQKVPTVVWAGEVPDETAAMANLLLPAHHPLETWRDTNPRAGVYGLGQPVMQPVFQSKAVGDILLSTIKNPQWPTSADAVKASWQALGTKAGGSFDDFWVKARREGGLYQDQQVSTVKLNLAAAQVPAPRPSRQLSLYAYPHIFLYDGRGADKPWLQEIPEPVTQIVWDNWAEIHPDTAEKLGVAQDGILELKTDQGVIQLPALVRDTVAPFVIAVPFGQGHTAYGRYAKDVGANPWAVLAPSRTTAAVDARPTGGSRRLVTPLGKDVMLGRQIIEAMTIEQLAGGVEPEREEPHVEGPYEMYAPWDYPKHKWGMTIDVNACTGCSACVAACYAENNVPVVGKERVDEGRIMSWIRIERYYPEEHEKEHSPLLYLAPMLCQQCDHAPCEPVCPVFAAYHTQEGLNGQVYNRCVGTRYCENNCPYKVRRFNYFLYDFPAPLNLQLNPDVTVRSAGVMEKCTFCIQRIQYGELDAMQESRPVRDGEITPACAQACPAKAITFGDIKDSSSAMMQRRDNNKLRDYRSLEELNTQPAIVYLRDLYHEKGKA